MNALPKNPLPKNPLLEQFLSEARDLLEGIGQKLMQLEDAPSDQNLINELFRMVHTLKGNSGLFTFPEMTRVLHAGEDLLGKVRNGELAFSRELTDHLLSAMDFVGMLSNEIEQTECIDASRAADAVRLAESLRALMPEAAITSAESSTTAPSTPIPAQSAVAAMPPLTEIPEALRMEAFRRCGDGENFHWIAYQPAPDCFFQGDDPFLRARQTPGLLWGRVLPAEPLPPLAELDTYKCSLQFHLLTAALHEELAEYFRYVPDQVEMVAIDPLWLTLSERKSESQSNFSEAATLAEKSSPAAIENAAALTRLLAAQQKILALDDHPAWLSGRLKAVASVLKNLANSVGYAEAANQIEASLGTALAAASGLPLLDWLNAHQSQFTVKLVPQAAANESRSNAEEESSTPAADDGIKYGRRADDGIKFGRRAEDNQTGPRSLKVDQAKIDRLMNLIGELIVEKNALPYLAQRAEARYGVRELSREIKGKYSVINRIADEMQDAIMQVRMMAVSIVFQRFPRLVRDTSRKLGKEVQLVLEGEQTEADKNIIEALADPLIHIVRNSLDHGLETPEVRRAQGNPETGTLTIRAAQQADRVVIEIVDDGKGIDPAVIKRKAYEKGLIDEAALERISDREAVNLIFAAGLSTAAVVSDLSGRGVGMDVVRTAVEKLNGSVIVESEVGKGTSIRISLPLSMAVTQVMVIESDGQLFGVPMDNVIETVRVPRRSIHRIKQSMTAVLRGRVVPLKALNGLLGITAQPRANMDDELSVLLVQAGGGELGLLVDGFRETLGVIQKPMAGFLSNLSVWSGSALMGDGSVLMILNIREIV
jgi:two-component system chemotaxis sensor kinase CheA